MKNFEDLQSSTIEGAEYFEKMRSRFEEESADFEPEEFEETEEYEDEEQDCNCSDPGCPCGGRKYGRL